MYAVKKQTFNICCLLLDFVQIKYPPADRYRWDKYDYSYLLFALLILIDDRRSFTDNSFQFSRGLTKFSDTYEYLQHDAIVYLKLAQEIKIFSISVYVFPQFYRQRFSIFQ